jgi:hypothetical protein
LVCQNKDSQQTTRIIWSVIPTAENKKGRKKKEGLDRGGRQSFTKALCTD